MPETPVRIFHTADWHLGRVLHGQPLIDDQRYSLSHLVDHIKYGEYDAVVIAGDIYDRAVPPPDAVALFNDVLNDIAAANVNAVVIPGNHDSATRLGFASTLLDTVGIHFRCSYDRLTTPITVRGQGGSEVDIFALPFIEPAVMRDSLGDDTIVTTTNAADTALSLMRRARRDVPTVLVAHEFVGDRSQTSESERLFVGGARVLPASMFEGFDYVALGHLHRPQHVDRETIRYSGSLLPYSFSEVNDIKSGVSLTFQPGDPTPTIELIPVECRYPFVVLTDSYDELMTAIHYSIHQDSYVAVHLTDAGFHLNLHAHLRDRFPKLLELRQLPLEADAASMASAAPDSTPTELFDAFLACLGWNDDDERHDAIAIYTEALTAVGAQDRETPHASA